MPFPRTGNDHTVELLIIQHLLKLALAAGVHLWLGYVELGDMLQRLLQRSFLYVADGYDLVALYA